MISVQEPVNTSLALIDYVDIGFKAATFITAVSNLIFAILIYKLKNKKEDIDKEKDRRINWLKTLVLDYNLDHFYAFFDNVEPDLYRFKQTGLTDSQKQDIDAKVADHFITLRRKFIDSILAVDQTLYDNILIKSDSLQEHITNSVFDQGINLIHGPKFDDVLLKKLNETKTEIVKLLFSYRG